MKLKGLTQAATPDAPACAAPSVAEKVEMHQLSDAQIMEISDNFGVTFVAPGGHRESPLIEGVDVTMDILACVRTILAMSHTALARHCYARFCRLRDHRAAGAEAPKHTEAEAFDLALAATRSTAQGIVMDAGLPELREHLMLAAAAEAPITLSHFSASALFHAMSTGAPQQAALPAPAPQECWSADEENFNSGSLGDLLNNNDLVVGSTVWSGEAETPELSELCSAQDVIDTMADRASDIAGEHADDYPDVSSEAKAKLDALLSVWMAEHCPPRFYTVTNVRPHTLTADDLTPPQPESTT